MRKVLNFSIICGCFALLLFYATEPNITYGGNLAEDRRQLQIVENEVWGINQQMSAMNRQIYEIEQELNQVLDELDIIQRNLKQTWDELDMVRAQLDEAVIMREDQQEAFAGRVRIMYMSGPASYIDVLMGASSFSELMKRMNFINRIVAHDQSLVNDLLATEATIADSLAIIERNEALLLALEIQENTRRLVYEERLAERQNMLAALESDHRQSLQRMWDLERSIREAENIIRAQERLARAQATPNTTPSTNRVIVDTSSLNGAMAWPVPGRYTISSPFGPRRSPISGRNEHHSGIDIPAPHGTALVAAESGVVIFQGWMNGYGNTIIIDHGDGLSTLYAHNSRNLVSVGESVAVGQHIGAIGNTGWSTGNHSHFEVRFNGSFVDPMNFLN